MNIKAAERALKKLLNKQLGLTFEYDVKRESLQATNSLTIKGHDDSVFATIDVFKNGSFSMEFVFDKLAMSPHTLTLLSEYNARSTWLTAFIRDDGFLVLRYNVMFIGNGDLIDNVRGAFDELIADHLREPLQALTARTKPIDEEDLEGFANVLEGYEAFKED